MPDRAAPAVDSIGSLVDHAADLLVRHLSDRADMTASAGFVMNRLHREGPTRLTTLAAKEGVSQPSMTQLIQRLERRGLVAKVADPGDGRATLIGVTEDGIALMNARAAARRERLAKLLAAISDEERDALTLAARVALPVLQSLAATADTLCLDTADEQGLT
ncbi:MarR family winged helix-turn-helix transcriptional regulator [Mycobacterium kyogaense]|uniref:MarR family winged helix-turn-helix transcriptional regulator n=1 Tax=Mycobacterium kyogaense TaxID=2212479 RepID=UPI001F08ED92|nr:MarR family transcriptional regulator [Mycobacterium kyogaense]